MNINYRVVLSHAERGELTALLSGGKHPARKQKAGAKLFGVCRWIDRMPNQASHFEGNWRRHCVRSRAFGCDRPCANREVEPKGSLI